MEKLNNTLKVKLLFIFLLSNISVYLFTNSSVEDTYIKQEAPDIYRPGYTSVKIRGNLRTDFIKNKPVSLLNKHHKLFIPYAILLEELRRVDQTVHFENSLETETSSAEYIIYLPEKYIPQLSHNYDFQILPYNKNFNLSSFQTKRNSYELHF
ncbi:MAG: hypothetical protein QF441_04340 [Bacteriovoracaceae bacterium]|jgi:hypothetical protein|nr:hypothetical protein [Halobacteriovoraceae bacterium]MDP7319810.1 hypothetical protein [Bacteriovoracaceae bacterium]|tara:strand:+ start:388 stop:846 length:459 start_codon:yes stop_codon:yes gene_type:complete